MLIIIIGNYPELNLKRQDMLFFVRKTFKEFATKNQYHPSFQTLHLEIGKPNF